MTDNTFTELLQSITTEPIFLLSPTIPIEKYTPLDLSPQNTQLKYVNVSSSDALEAYIWNHMKAHDAHVAYGGYLEQRAIYQRSDYFNQEDPLTERNIHLGLDLWIEADADVYAPLDGVVHSFANNMNYGDYGPTIILKHYIKEQTFYTLYGHLSLESINRLTVGTVFKKGEKIATLGDASVNGDYPPHLHFQIVKDMQHYRGDYPGVTNTQDLDFYKGNCPDPQLLLKLNL